MDLGKIMAKISELQTQLNITDYKAIKFAEGALSEEDYAETKTQREEWRKEIRKLENEAEKLTKDALA